MPSRQSPFSSTPSPCSWVTYAPRSAGWAELAICLALVAIFVLVMLIRLVIQIPDMDGIDG